jgi:hypothetical protein
MRTYDFTGIIKLGLLRKALEDAFEDDGTVTLERTSYGVLHVTVPSTVPQDEVLRIVSEHKKQKVK